MPLVEMTEQKILAVSESETHNDSVYNAEQLLRALFQKFPTNTATEEIAAKVLLLDRLYSTRIFDYKKPDFVWQVAENIRTIPDFDVRVQNGDPELVPLIYRGFERSMFSFATKYCCLHNTIIYDRDDYSIYDAAVHKLLPKYAKSVGVKLTGTQIEQWRKADDYRAFNDAVDTTLNAAEITVSGRKRKFDWFLWSQR